MRTRYWVSALSLAALLGAAAQSPLALPSGGSVLYSVSGPATRFEIQTKAGRKYSVMLERDSKVAANAQPQVKLIGEIAGKAVILTDTYASAPLGLHYCQAGEEQFLRVITLESERARQTLRLKLASCRDNIELADPGVEWNGETKTLQVHWLQGPAAKGQSEARTIHIGADGKPALEPARSH